MNKQTFLVLGLGATLLMTACKKNDLEQSAVANKSKAATAAATSSASWRSISNWSAQNQDKYTTYTTQIGDSVITGAVASKGLVLVFKKSGANTTALPYEEKTSTGSYFWYYQIASGGLSIIADGYEGAKTPASTEGFAYFVVPASKLSTLEAQGHSKAELMKLTYENAATLLK